MLSSIALITKCWRNNELDIENDFDTESASRDAKCWKQCPKSQHPVRSAQVLWRIVQYECKSDR